MLRFPLAPPTRPLPAQAPPRPAPARLWFQASLLRTRPSSAPPSPRRRPACYHLGRARALPPAASVSASPWPRPRAALSRLPPASCLRQAWKGPVALPPGSWVPPWEVAALGQTSVGEEPSRALWVRSGTFQALNKQLFGVRSTLSALFTGFGLLAIPAGAARAPPYSRRLVGIPAAPVMAVPPGAVRSPPGLAQRPLSGASG